jgi:hypothetical protein
MGDALREPSAGLEGEPRVAISRSLHSEDVTRAIEGIEEERRAEIDDTF